jgi:DNA-binding response OmpR family regulator
MGRGAEKGLRMRGAFEQGTARVLLVDDDAELLKLGRAQLERAGFRVIACCSGEEALRSAHDHMPDIALIDILMPGMNGWQICRALKSDPKTAALPVFFITCLGDEEDIHRHRRSGADGYFIKPLDIQVVVGRLSEIVEKQRQSQPSQALAR